MLDIPVNSVLIESYGMCQTETIRIYQYQNQKYVYVVNKKTVDAMLFDDMDASLRKWYERERAKLTYLKPKPIQARAPIQMKYPTKKR